MFYFAYGSNMDHNQMLKERCPGAIFVGPARLTGYWLVFDGYSTHWRGAVANILPSRDDEVWGGLFEISESQLKVLDGYEGYPRFYQRRQVNVDLRGRKDKIQAWVYTREPHPEGAPSHEYIAAVIKGAHDCHLPQDYIRVSFEINLKVPPAGT
ncbi:MAG: gamma-glutamylcyclotransferase [Candidatus Omnitrophica bacterium]|nr:gamma-glutamylcyclotransferase [Candidatus Omnitrophota bacterium]